MFSSRTLTDVVGTLSSPYAKQNMSTVVSTSVSKKKPSQQFADLASDYRVKRMPSSNDSHTTMWGFRTWETNESEDDTGVVCIESMRCDALLDLIAKASNHDPFPPSDLFPS